MAEERTRLKLMGAPGSPYTRKMLSMMRFRHIPYRLILQSRIVPTTGKQVEELPQPKVSLLPTFYLPNEAGEEVAVTDSTPLIRRFEKEYDGRSVIPSDPAMSFINDLLEDFADEWLTKAMFHYRWWYDADIEKAGDILPRWGAITATDEEIAPFSEFIRKRQIDRLSYVGSNAVTKPVIEASYLRIIKLLADHLTQYPFIMGDRPGSADFAFYGQLTCLALFDPTPAALTLKHAPRVSAWVEVMEDQSGLLVDDADWITSESVPDTLKALLGEVGRLYAPYLIGNAEAVMSGAEKLEMTLDGQPWEQNPFTYQAKCLTWLREGYGELGGNVKTSLDAVLDGTGVEQLFE